MRCVVLVLAVTLGAVACVETAVTPEEKMVRGCERFEAGVQADSHEQELREFRDARRWVHNAVQQDEGLRPIRDEIDRLILDLDDVDREDRDVAVVRQVRERVLDACQEYGVGDVEAGSEETMR